MKSIVLASSSSYRRHILDKLGLSYQWRSPNIDETPRPGESAPELVKRLAKNKALALAERYPQSLIIGADQVAVIDDKILGKPHNHDTAVAQLTNASNRRVIFFTGLCLYNSQSKQDQTICEPYYVHFRDLSTAQIEHYLRQEKPYDCAGSFKAESRGICLFARLEGRDPNTLIGLPLIALIDMLIKEGIDPLTTGINSAGAPTP